MGAFASWINHCPTDVDSIPALSVGGATTVHAFDPGYPGANCLGNEPAKVTRVNYTRTATAAANMTFTVQWVTGLAPIPDVRIVTLQNVRLSNFTFVQCSTISFSGTLIQTCPLSYTPANVQPIAGTTDRYNLTFVFTSSHGAAGVRIDIRTPASFSGYYEIGVIRAGPAFYDATGADREWTTGYIDEGQGKRTPGGALSAQQLPRRIKLSMSLSAQSYESAYGNSVTPTAPSLDDMYMYCGNTLPIVICVRDNNPWQLQKHTVYGSIVSKSAIKHTGGDRYITSLEVEQIR